MSFLSKLFGKKERPRKTPQRKAVSKSKTPSTNANDGELIQVYDSYGRAMQITKREWRTNILPGILNKEWDNPDNLYSIIINSLEDGFLADVIDAARHLYHIDQDQLRASCLWGIVLMQNGQLSEAENILNDYTKKHGESGVILTNLAKIYEERHEAKKTETTLWHALELDPNQDNALMWYMARARQSGGPPAEQAALKRIAALPKSWRAHVWLARTALEAQKRDAALTLYRTAIAHAGYPPPSDLLMQISGDLGNNGHLHDILQLVEPHFSPEIHGLQVGNNLLKASIVLNKYDVAQRILDQLYAQKRPDWKEHLNYWDTELAKKKVAAGPVPSQEELELSMLTVDGPVWLKPDAPAATLFPVAEAQAPSIAFIGCTAETEEHEQEVVRQLADARGRLSRALPLFLAEQVAQNIKAHTHTLFPYIIKPTPGFVLLGQPFPDDDAAERARASNTPSDYVIITHISTNGDECILNLRLVRTIDAACLLSTSATCSMQDPSQAVQELAKQTLTALQDIAKFSKQEPSSHYLVPTNDWFMQYMLRLEQLLAIRCSAMDGVGTGLLHGEREIIDGTIQLCLAYPQSVNVRLILLQMLIGMKQTRPEIVKEFAEQMKLLQNEHPLPGPAQELVKQLLSEKLG